MFDFNGKTAVVTGSARGIGRNIAVGFAAGGADTVLIDINAGSLMTTCRELKQKGLPVYAFEFDLSRTDRLADMINDIHAQFGNIDYLVNNARAGKRTLPLGETIDNFDLISDVSLKAPLFLSQAFIRQSVDFDKDRGKASSRCIINISSVAAKTVCRESAGYHISKAALENLTRYLAVHGGNYGFRVNAIRPGFIVQDEHKKRYEDQDNKGFREIGRFCHPLKKIGSSDDIANAVLFLCSDLAGFITGQVLTVDGGLTIQDQWDLIHSYHHTEGK